MVRRFATRAAVKRLALAMLGLIALMLGAPLGSRSQSASAAQLPPGSLVYEVTISGSVSGRPFTRTGYVVLSPSITNVTTNGINPLDVWLTSGNPLAAPEVGAISFATNNLYLGSLSRVDLAYVSYDGASRTITVQPDPNYAGLGANVFNNSSGLLGGIYQIYAGTMQLQLSEDARAITGSIGVVGKGAYYYTQVPYQGTITGRFVGTV